MGTEWVSFKQINRPSRVSYRKGDAPSTIHNSPLPLPEESKRRWKAAEASLLERHVKASDDTIRIRT